MMVGWKYRFINVAVLLFTALWFIHDYGRFRFLFSGFNVLWLIIVLVTVILVHMVKAFRLYFALYGSDISFIGYVKTYCKVTPVSVVIPYKLGELFRMYCYGCLLEDSLKGMVVILLDRFMDTTGLITIAVLIAAFFRSSITGLTYFLVIFITLLLMLYLSFPGIYRFWKHYLLKAKATGKRIAVIRRLDSVNRIYGEISRITRGRGILFYFLSLTAWGVEIGSLAVQNSLFLHGDLDEKLSAYLSSALGSMPTAELRQFVFVSVAVLIFGYLVVKIYETAGKKKMA